MKIDGEFSKLIDRIEGQLTVLPNGKEIVSVIKNHFKPGTTIQDATFRLVNDLFADYGLVVLIPDNAVLKMQAARIFEDDLVNQTASTIVETTAAKLEAAGYKVQANPREINLFYLKDDKRERIEKKKVNDQLRRELADHPDRFSPNVILRGIFQETILPDVAFIGGAGELGYWLQLKTLFDHYKVPFPVLLLRNSFLLVEKKWQERIGKLGFTAEEFFLPAGELLGRLVSRESKKEIRLNGSLDEIGKLYEAFKRQAASVDSSLEKHVDALKTKSVYRLQELEKKMLRAEKRKYTDQQRQITSIKQQLFPNDGLQERTENISYYYSKWGKDFLQQLYVHSLTLEQEFVLLKEK